MFGLFGPKLSPETHLSVTEAHEKAKAGEVTLIDVRSPQEWMSTGVPEGAKLLSLNHPGGENGLLSVVLNWVEEDKNAPVAVICRTGARSGAMQNFLKANGFTQVWNVTEGMIGSSAGPGWIQTGLPTSPYSG